MAISLYITQTNEPFLNVVYMLYIRKGEMSQHINKLIMKGYVVGKWTASLPIFVCLEDDCVNTIRAPSCHFYTVCTSGKVLKRFPKHSMFQP